MYIILYVMIQTWKVEDKYLLISERKKIIPEEVSSPASMKIYYFQFLFCGLVGNESIELINIITTLGIENIYQ